MKSPLENPPSPLAAQGGAKPHLGYLDGLRAMAALYVVVHHSFLQVSESKAPPSAAFEWFQGFVYGRYAVDLFIVLSGFCLMLPIVKYGGQLRGGALAFFGRRAWRILPSYYCALLLSLLLAGTLVGQKTGTHWDVSLPVTVGSIISHAFLLHDLVGDDFSINHAFWSIAVEWRIYFLFPLLVVLWRRLGPWATTGISVVGAFVLSLVLQTTLGRSLTAEYIGLFVLGMLATTLSFSDEERFARLRRFDWGFLSTVLALVVVAFSVGPLKLPHPYAPMDILVGIWATTLLVWVSRGNNWGHRVLSYGPLVWMGTFAYSIYLIHSPLIQVLWQYPFAPLQGSAVGMFLALALVGTPLIVAASYLFFLACERPFVRKREARGQKPEVRSQLVEVSR